MEQILENLSQSLGLWGYAILFFYSLGGGIIALLAAGILSSVGGLNLALCIFVAALSNFIGSSGLFFLSRFQKHEVLRLFKKHRRKLALSHIWIKKYDFWVIFIHKYIYGIKTLIPLVVGFSKYSAARFALLNALSCILWGALGGALGFLLGDAIKEIYTAKAYLLPIFGLFLAAAGYILLVRSVKKGEK